MRGRCQLLGTVVDRQGEASDVLLAQFRRRQCAAWFRRQPTRARPWNGAQGHDLRSDKTASPPPLSQPHTPIRRTLLPAHALTPVTLETPNTQLVLDFCTGTLPSPPTFLGGAFCPDLWHPQCFSGAAKPMLILKLQFAFQQLCRLPVHWRVVCTVLCICAAQNVHNVQFRDSRCLTMQLVTYMHTFIFTSLFAAYTMSSLSLSA